MTVKFKEGLKNLQEKEAAKRHPEPPARVEQPGRSPSRQGKVPLTQWVDQAVRKQVQQIGLDHDKTSMS